MFDQHYQLFGQGVPQDRTGFVGVNEPKTQGSDFRVTAQSGLQLSEKYRAPFQNAEL